MTSRSLARALALSSTLAAFGWSFAGGCGGHPLSTPHPSGGAGKGAAGSTGTAGSGSTGMGAGTAGSTASGAAGSAASGEAGSTASGAAGATSVGVGGTIGSGAGGVTLGAGGSPYTQGCLTAQNGYANLRDKLVAGTLGVGCGVDSDCAALPEPAACGSSCPSRAIPVGTLPMILAELQNNVQFCSSSCPIPLPTPCPANPAVCRKGQCALAGIVGAGGASGSGTGGGSGSTGGAGQGGTAGAPACGPCAEPLCKPGYMSVVDPSISCCPICRPINCANVLCAQPVCPAGSHTEVPAGQCCPVCVMGFSQACNTAQSNYATSRQAFLQKYGSFPCKQDSECRLVFEENSCVFNCGEALPVTTAVDFETNISGYAAACNMACPPNPAPPCLPQVAVCSNGTCTSVPQAGLGLN
jgi:hypothetical protein